MDRLRILIATLGPTLGLATMIVAVAVVVVFN